MPATFLLALALAKSTFVEQMQTAFDLWDTNKDGVLSAQELDDQLTNPDIRGERAAALGTLKLVSRAKKTKELPLTKDLLLSGAKDPVNFESRFSSALKMIRNRSRDLFVGGPPALETIHQGRLGDCFLLANIGAMVMRDPQQVAGMITQSGDNYTVHFVNDQNVDVKALTDAELVLVSTDENSGLWLCYLEEGYGKLTALKKGKTIVAGTDAVASGGSARTAMQNLTGHSARTLATTPKSDMTVEQRMQEIRDAINDNLAHKLLIVASVSTKAPKVPGISQKHAYAVIGFDPAIDAVQLWNPHGNGFTPKGPAGLDNGYPTTRGKFWITLTDASKAITSFTFETPDKGKP